MSATQNHFSDKKALITGSARGIGRAIAEDFAAWGAEIVIIDMDQGACDQTASEIAKQYGVKATGVHCNVTSKSDVDSLHHKIKEEIGGLDFLINNAGVTRDNLLLRMKEEEWDMVLDVNLKGAFLMTQAMLPFLMKSHGRIVNISSVSGLYGNIGQANYSSSKAGLIGLTKVTAREYASKGVRCNAICPGFVKTDMTANLPQKAKEMMESAIPLGRPAEVHDISRVIRFLCSEDGGYITGNVIRVDGGMMIGV